MPDIYQPKYLHLLMDPNQGDPVDAVHPPFNPTKLAELKALITLAGDVPATPGFPTGTVLAASATGNGTSTVLNSVGRVFTNDILLRFTTVAGATPTVTFNIKTSPDGVTFTNINYALIATPNTFVNTAVTTAATGTVSRIYRIPASALLAAQARQLQVVVSANTNMTYSIDVWDFGGVPNG